MRTPANMSSAKTKPLSKEISGLACVAGKPLLAGFQEFLRPIVIKALGNPLTPAQRGDRLLTTQSLQHNADLLLRAILLAGYTTDVLDDLLRRRFPCSGFLSHLRSF